MKRIIIFTTFLIILFNSTVFAANWEYAASTGARSRIYYIDTSSVMRDDYNIFHVFVKMECNNYYEIMLEYFKLINGVKYYAITDVSRYKYSGDLIYSNNVDLRWFVVPPESAAEGIYETSYQYLR